jgi:hypothetical protein
MKTNFDGVPVNLCSAPAFMGHEEIVLPMLVVGSSERERKEAIGTFRHCGNDHFEPNDLANTAVVGYTSGHYPVKLDLRSLFVGTFPNANAWTRIPEITSALVGLARQYAFFVEESGAPLQDAFVRRCRLVARKRLLDFHPKVDIEAETAQDSPATDVLASFLRHSACETRFEKLYGGYYRSREYYRLYGDDEQFWLGYAIWLEQEGVVRAWTRVTYVPK